MTRLTVFALLLTLASPPIWADPPRAGRPDSGRPDIGRPDANRPDFGRPDGRPDFGRPDGRRPDSDRPGADSPRRDRTPPRVDVDVRFDSRHRHDRYYPPRGRVFDHPPRHPVAYPWRDRTFFFDNGIWFSPLGTRFVVTAPPIGIGIATLPPYYTTVWVRGIPYYYADEVYYTWQPERREYVVVEAPKDAEVYVPPNNPEQLYVYPKEGQDEATQATDRYECHRWAVDQTRYDPTQPDPGLPEDQLAGKRADYQRATKACLEARGYSVR